MHVWEADVNVVSLVNEVKNKWHKKRLENANIAVNFNDSKPFISGRFNWGKTSKFTSLAKLWHPQNKKYDFLISLPGDAWFSLLDKYQREALIDLHLTRCQVEYMPAYVQIGSKKEVAKDEWGRIQYTDEVKLDAEGNPKWRVAPLDLNVFQDNVSRYGCWCKDLLDFSNVIKK